MNVDLQKALENYSVSPKALEAHHARVSSAYNFTKPDYKPVVADIRWWMVEQWHDGNLERELSRCDTDKVLLSCISYKSFTGAKLREIDGIKLTEEWSGPPVVYVNGGYPGSKRTMTLDTPKGCITASEEYASRSFGIVDYPVKTIEDLRVARYAYEKIAKYGEGDVYGCAPMTPIQILLIQLAGVENTVYLLMDHQEEVEDFLSFLEELFKPGIIAFSKKTNLVFSVENFSADVSSGYYERYIHPVLFDRSGIAKKHGAIIGVHHDGKLMPMLGKLKDSGVGYINGITASPSGDVEPEKIREIVGDGVVIADIFPQAIFMEDFSDQNFADYVKKVAIHYKNDHGVIFGIGDMLPCISDIKRFETMINIIREVTV